MDFQLEKVRHAENGIYITHSRAKQRSDKRSTTFLVPKPTGGGIDFVGVLDQYMDRVKTDLGKFSGVHISLIKKIICMICR